MKEKATSVCDFEVSCISLPPPLIEMSSDDMDVEDVSAKATSKWAAIGLWNVTVCVLSLPGLRNCTTEVMEAEAIPRSVLFNMFDDVMYLLVGMGGEKMQITF